MPAEVDVPSWTSLACSEFRKSLNLRCIKLKKSEKGSEDDGGVKEREFPASVLIFIVFPRGKKIRDRPFGRRDHLEGLNLTAAPTRKHPRDRYPSGKSSVLIIVHDAQHPLLTVPHDDVQHNRPVSLNPRRSTAFFFADILSSYPLSNFTFRYAGHPSRRTF